MAAALLLAIGSALPLLLILFQQPTPAHAFLRTARPALTLGRHRPAVPAIPATTTAALKLRMATAAPPSERGKCSHEIG